MSGNELIEVRFTCLDEIKNWNDYISNNPDKGNVLQGFEYSLIKSTIGWMPVYILVGNLAITVLERHFGPFRHWYIPKCTGSITSRESRAHMDALIEFARKNKVSVVTLDPENPDAEEIASLGLVKRFDIQANVTTKILDISKNPEEILNSLPGRARYAIRRAINEGVQASAAKATDENCKVMYDLMKEAVGKKSKMYSFDYYREFWQRYDENNLGRMFFAFHEGKIVAGAFALAFGTRGTYKDGGSIKDRKVYGASHLLQWEIILWLKRLEVTSYDLCGAPPLKYANSTEHRLYGVGLFKASFVPETTEYAGTYDVIVQPRLGKIWHSYGERIASATYRRLLKASYY